GLWRRSMLDRALGWRSRDPGHVPVRRRPRRRCDVGGLQEGTDPLAAGGAGARPGPGHPPAGRHRRRHRERSDPAGVGHDVSSQVVHGGSAVPSGRRARRPRPRLPRAGAYIADERGERLVPIAGYHIPLDLRDALGAASISLERVPALVEAWRAGELIASVDVHADARFDSEWTSRLPTHAMLLAPLRIRGVSMGALGLGWRSGGRESSPRETRVVEGVARPVGLALDNAELTRQREIKLRETETLLSVSRTLSSTLDLNALLRQFLRQAVVALGADSVGIYLLDDDGEF